jgi:glycosyltransferase involved in cell wall biosynthesis
MVRVLHIIESLGNGGAEHQLAAMLVRSDHRRFQHAVCALGQADWHRATIRDAGIPVYMLDRVPRREIRRTLKDVRGVLREVDPDVVHTSLYWSGVLGRALTRLTGKPVVTTLSNTTYEPEWRQDNPRLTPAKMYATRWLDGVTARWWGTWFVAISKAVRASAIRQLGISPDRVSIIPRGLEFEKFSQPTGQVSALRAELGWNDAYPVIVSVGRLVPQKGHRYAIEAMTEVARALPRALLVLVGEGSLHSELEGLARSLGLTDRVRLLGGRHDVPAVLAAADQFVFPSLFEGFGAALIEALAAGRPCVASRIPPVVEVTDDGRVALLVEPRSPGALAAGMIQLGTDRVLAARLGEEAAAWVHQQYDITASIRKFETLLDALASGRSIEAGEVTLGIG